VGLTLFRQKQGTQATVVNGQWAITCRMRLRQFS